MIKKFNITGIDCAVCAGKLEAAINKLDGVTAKLGFLTETLVFGAADEVFEARLGEAKKLIKKFEPGARLEAR